MEGPGAGSGGRPGARSPRLPMEGASGLPERLWQHKDQGPSPAPRIYAMPALCGVHVVLGTHGRLPDAETELLLVTLTGSCAREAVYILSIQYTFLKKNHCVRTIMGMQGEHRYAAPPPGRALCAHPRALLRAHENVPKSLEIKQNDEVIWLPFWGCVGRLKVDGEGLVL